MIHMISTISISGTTVPGMSLQNSQKHIQYLVLLLTFCIFTLTAIAQPGGSFPDTNNTYGEGSRVRTTQSTNPDTFIPETKTEFFDKNGVLREERIQTKDYDGNTVIINKKYDKTGLLKSRHEVRKDGINAPIFDEDLEYDDAGKIKKGSKQIWKGWWIYFDFDRKKQEYKESSSYGYMNTASPKEQLACNCSKTELKVGYSYMRTANTGSLGTLPTGAEMSISRRLGNHMGLILDVNGHQNKQSFQTLSRLNLQAGIQYNIKKCDDDDNVSVFTRIAIGMSMEYLKTKVKTTSANAPAGTAGLGADIKISGKMSVYLSADWAPSYFNKALQSNFQAGAGLAIKFGSNN